MASSCEQGHKMQGVIFLTLAVERLAPQKELRPVVLVKYHGFIRRTKVADVFLHCIVSTFSNNRVGFRSIDKSHTFHSSASVRRDVFVNSVEPCVVIVAVNTLLI